MSRLLTECFNAVTFIHASSDMPYFAHRVEQKRSDETPRVDVCRCRSYQTEVDVLCNDTENIPVLITEGKCMREEEGGGDP